MNNLGSKINHQRKILGWSLQKLADKIIKSKAHVFEIELGKSDPSITTLKDIAKALNISIMYLIDDNYNIGTYPHEPHYCQHCTKIEAINKIINS